MEVVEVVCRDCGASIAIEKWRLEHWDIDRWLSGLLPLCWICRNRREGTVKSLTDFIRFRKDN